MSYSIIFETKMIDLSDGRILHLSLSGCNNDNAGRSRDDFRGKIMTREELNDYIDNLKKDSVPYKDADGFDLKIGSRYATWYDYGKHLERALRHATSLEVLKVGRIFVVQEFLNVDIWIDREHYCMSVDEFNDEIHKLMYSGKRIRYHINTRPLESEREIVEAIDRGAHLRWHIGRLEKRKVS